MKLTFMETKTIPELSFFQTQLKTIKQRLKPQKNIFKSKKIGIYKIYKFTRRFGCAQPSSGEREDVFTGPHLEEK